VCGRVCGRRYIDIELILKVDYFHPFFITEHQTTMLHSFTYGLVNDQDIFFFNVNDGMSPSKSFPDKEFFPEPVSIRLDIDTSLWHPVYPFTEKAYRNCRSDSQICGHGLGFTPRKISFQAFPAIMDQGHLHHANAVHRVDT
jgi:hypothetical protein